MKQQNFWEKITYKKIAVCMVVLFLVSLLPIIYCSFFNYATGDDLWEGAVAHRVLVNQGTIGEFFREIYEWAKIDYLSWEGNWSSIILWCLEPSIWGEKVYCITPFIALISICGGSAYFLFYYLKKYLGVNKYFCIMVSTIICFFSVQYMPYVKSGIFWYTGMINYVFPYGLCLAAFVWMDKFIEKGKKRYLVFTSIFFAYLGGAGYIPIVFAFEITFFIMMVYFLKNKSGQRERIFWLLIPFLLLVIGFVFSAVSPGNAARGGESYRFEVVRIFTTIFECIKQGFLTGIKTFISVRPLFLVIPLLVIAVWEQLDVEKSKLKFNHPVFVIAFLFLVSCSVYAPGIYAQSEVSGGVPDTIYFIFLLCCVFSIIYLTGYLKSLYIRKNWHLGKDKSVAKVRTVIVLGEILFCIVAGKYLVSNMADYVCIDFIRTGQLRDFEYQMQERLTILQNPKVKNVVLPEMNNEQGPFMHMALLDNPDAYTNQATARFYGKESVIAIPRQEYYELYGYPENKE